MFMHQLQKLRMAKPEAEAEPEAKPEQ